MCRSHLEDMQVMGSSPFAIDLAKISSTFNAVGAHCFVSKVHERRRLCVNLMKIVRDAKKINYRLR